MNSNINKQCDVIVIGAGAAGLMCAIEAGKRGRAVLVLDHAKKPAEKIRISGGGRCNFTNLHCAPDRFVSQNPHFCKSALARFTAQDFIAMVTQHGIAWHEKSLGQLFCNDSAQLIIDMLCGAVRNSGGFIQTETAVEHIEKTDAGFTLSTSRGAYACEHLVIATGGPSIPKMGASGFAYEIARQFGLNVVTPAPALVPLTFTDDILSLTKELSGVSVDPVIVTCGKTSFREALLFTHRGLSGPAILQISTYWQPGDEISIDLIPDKDLLMLLKETRTAQPRQMLHTALSAYLPERLARALAVRSTHDVPMAELSDRRLQEVAAIIQNWRVKPNGSEGYRTAEVTRGGIDTAELSSRTFEARKCKGLYFIGECIDVTGWLGGYNFQWAWASGYCAGQVV